MPGIIAIGTAVNYKELIMKKAVFFLGLVSIFCLLGLGFISCDNGTNDSPLIEWDETRPIVCIGDSQMSGWFTDPDNPEGAINQKGADYPEKSWPALLQEKVKVDVINAAKGGETTTGALARIEKDVVSKNPQIVIISLGGNDIVAGADDIITGGFAKFQTVTETMRDNLQAIIDKVKSPDRKLYLANYLSEEYSNKVLAKYASSLPEENKKMFYNYLHYIYLSFDESDDIELIDEYLTAEICNSHLQADGVHPDEAGIVEIADIIFAKIKPFLQEHNLVK
jgi:lysophospholipase L1-like esterase